LLRDAGRWEIVDEPSASPDPLLELPPIRGEPLSRRISTYVRRHWARLAILAGIAVTVSHALGGIAGLWEFMRVVRGEHATVTGSTVAPHSATPAQPPFRSMVVLPLEAAASTPDEEQFARGVTLQLTSAATHAFRDGLVVSNGLAQRFRDRPRDPRAVGRELNVRYVIDGNLKGAGPTRELTVELIDSTDGSQLWMAREFFGASGDGSETVKRMRNGLRNAVIDATEKEIRLLPKEQKALWDLVLRAWSSSPSLRELREEQELYEQALKLDPAFIPALFGLAHVLQLRTNNEPENHDALVAEIDDLSLRGIRAAPNDARAWNTRQMALRLQGNWSAAFDANDQAMRLDPFRSQTIERRAALLVYAGRPAEALPLLDRVLELDPVDQEAVAVWRCVAYVHLARHREALTECEKAAALFPYWTLYGFATAAAAQSGETQRAEKWKRKLLEANPKVSIALLHSLRDSDSPAFKAQRENLIAGLRKAGIPES
jgi:TolB-like protein/tetratricopeptide (TPR) repeat protein